MLRPRSVHRSFFLTCVPINVTLRGVLNIPRVSMALEFYRTPQPPGGAQNAPAGVGTGVRALSQSFNQSRIPLKEDVGRAHPAGAPSSPAHWGGGLLRLPQRENPLRSQNSCDQRWRSSYFVGCPGHRTAGVQAHTGSLPGRDCTFPPQGWAGGGGGGGRGRALPGVRGPDVRVTSWSREICPRPTGFPEGSQVHLCAFPCSRVRAAGRTGPGPL